MARMNQMNSALLILIFPSPKLLALQFLFYLAIFDYDLIAFEIRDLVLGMTSKTAIDN